MPPRKPRKKKTKLPKPNLIKIRHTLKVGDAVTFTKPTHFDGNGLALGDQGVISKIVECSYATGGWMIWLEGTPQHGSGYSIFYFIDKEFPSAWSRND